MRCPACRHKKTPIIRTRPDPEFDSTVQVRQCKNVACLVIFTTNESVVSIIENSRDRRVLLELQSRIDALAPGSRDQLFKMLEERGSESAKQ